VNDGGDLRRITNAMAPENRQVVALVNFGRNNVWERYQGDVMETLDLRSNRSFRVVTYAGYVSVQALENGMPTGDVQDMPYDDFDRIVYVRGNPQLDRWLIGRLIAVQPATQNVW